MVHAEEDVPFSDSEWLLANNLFSSRFPSWRSVSDSDTASCSDVGPNRFYSYMGFFICNIVLSPSLTSSPSQTMSTLTKTTQSKYQPLHFHSQHLSVSIWTHSSTVNPTVRLFTITHLMAAAFASSLSCSYYNHNQCIYSFLLWSSFHDIYLSGSWSS